MRRFEGAAAWRHVAEELGPPGMYARTIGMPTYGYPAPARTRLRSARKIANPRPPRSRDAAQWRQLAVRPAGGKRRRLAAAGAVNLARIPPAQSVKLVTESI
jgi:hypothetical protein